MNAVGIDISKDKSTFAIIQPLVGVVAEPYEVHSPKVNSKNSRLSDKLF